MAETVTPSTWQRHPRGPVVVGVDGSPDGFRALRYAVEEARRSGTGLRLVHVAQETIPMAGAALPLDVADVLEEAARDTLEEALAAAGTLAPDLEVEAVLARGGRVHAMLDRSADASLVVLGQRPSALRRWVTGSTTAGVAAQAHCPVVCVPAGWDPAVPATGRVVAGIDGGPGSVHVVEAAHAAATARGARLSLLHAWRPTAGYDAAIGARVMKDAWREATERTLSQLATQATGSAEGVDLDVEYLYPLVALGEASEHADLLVVGRHGEGAPFGLSLGSTARALVRHGHCPVEVVPLPRHEPASG